MRLRRRLVASNRCGDWRERALKIEGKAGGRVIFPNISVTQNYYLSGVEKLSEHRINGYNVEIIQN